MIRDGNCNRIWRKSPYYRRGLGGVKSGDILTRGDVYKRQPLYYEEGETYDAEDRLEDLKEKLNLE